ncbi:type 2 isopentenyl-diphosphate Delta-isomerase [Nocardia brasiliensis]|uniref:type 2 isopentenyl-diphosphate Delta-isomerase n=1 Tax=Nocardia brasiliensis TaxID=37326 RepID=UPI0024573E44|nr:type 2 isopentenyl-diphosphate Delta-isomerase [Nocardia brasiliensis]
MTALNMIGNRKDDHLRLAVEQHNRPVGASDFDSVRFIHHALAGIDRADVDLSTEVAGTRWATPLYINAMTGGSERAGAVNRELAIAAAETGVPIASGSMSAFLRDPTLADSYRVLRQHNPDGVVIANVNANATPDQACRAIDHLSADALQIHLNAFQEIVMPEGDRDFSHWPRRIEAITAAVDVPVIVKEVGFGLSGETVALLRDLGVAVADVAGRGGTDFARIENDRRADHGYASVTEWGQSTPCCLLDSAGIDGIDLLASGGIRGPLDIARAMALGARGAGAAGVFLTILTRRGTEALIETIRDWLDQLTSIMTVLGARNPRALTRCGLLLDGPIETYCRLNGIDPRPYVRRDLPAHPRPVSIREQEVLP